jgi:uncharacterized protein YoxC
MSNPKPPVVDASKDIPEQMSDFWQHFTTITKDESDYIEEILHWSQDTKAAFVMAKRIFDEKNDTLAEKSEVL